MSVRVMMPAAGRLTDEEEAALPEEVRAKQDAIAKEKQKFMSKPGKLGLPPLLDERRLEHGMSDACFSFQPFDDRIILWQVSRTAGDTYEGGKILMTESRKQVEEESNPAGIILAAGAKALDSLRMNGMDLGDMVTFLNIAPWRYQTRRFSDGWEEVLTLTVGNIVGSFDLRQRMLDGDTEVVFDEKLYEHYYLDKDGKLWKPQHAKHFNSEDYQ